MTQIEEQGDSLRQWQSPVHLKADRLLTLTIECNGKKAEALIDSGSQLNLISALKAKELGLRVDPLESFAAEAANRSKMTVYGTTVADLAITDSRGVKRTHTVGLLVTEVTAYPIYLGMPWIESHNPKLNFATKKLRHRDEKVSIGGIYQKVVAEDGKEFTKTLSDSSSDVYVLVVHMADENGLIREGEGEWPSRYADFADVGSEDLAKEIGEHGPHDLSIELTEGFEPPWSPLYNLSESELVALRKYLDDYVARGWIRHSRSPAGAPILFAKKKDGSLRLCVDYRGLNKVTVKNRGPLPLIQESLIRLSQAKLFTKLDLKEAYHRIRIKEGDEWKTAFRTRYGHFEYMVMPFGLTNAPAVFQAHINQVLAGLVDVTCIVYLDDILIFSEDERSHERHVREVLQRLRDAKLYCNPKKCQWHTRTTEFLGYQISPEGVSMDPERVKTIRDWPLPRSVGDIRVFVGFLNYYRRFIHGFSEKALPLTRLTRKAPDAAKKGRALRKEESQYLDIGPDGRRAWQELKDAFLEVPILANFERNRRTKAEVDASGGAISGILSQIVPDGDNLSTWRPIDFFSQKLTPVEQRYDTHDLELLAMVRCLVHWRHYLDRLPFELYSDHRNLKWFMETKVLNHRQVRAYITLSKFDFVLVHRPGKVNPADGPSRRPDYMAEAKKSATELDEVFLEPMRRLLSRTARSSSKPNGEVGGEVDAMIGSITRSQDREGADQKLQRAIHRFVMNDGAEVSRSQQLSSDDGSEVRRLTPEDEATSGTSEAAQLDQKGSMQLRTRKKKSRVVPRLPLRDEATPGTSEVAQLDQKGPMQLRTREEKSRAIIESHDSPLAGHFGVRRTLEKLRRRFRWSGMTRDVREYVRTCSFCNKAVARRHKPHGLLQPLPVPDGPWRQVTMDFVTELPPSRRGEEVFDSILVIVDRFTKMSHYVAARADWDGEDLARSWIREVVRLHGCPQTIISDRGPLMSAKHWDTFNHYLNSVRVLTSAYHPQTDGQTERQNQTLEQYLRCYCCVEQDDWSLWISLAEYAYNDSVHSTTGMTPFFACYGFHPQGADWPDRSLGDGESPKGLQMATKLIEVRAECARKIKAANKYQEELQNRSRKELVLEVGDQVYVNSRHIKSFRPKKKLDWKYLGPGTVIEKISDVAYRVDLPGAPNIHPVFHVSLLEPFVPKPSLEHPEVEAKDTLQQVGDDVYEIDKILDREQDEDGGWRYLVSWKGYPAEENSWEPSINISGNALKAFFKKKGIGPRRAKKAKG